MANIYLRVPTYVAQFYRGRETDHPLTEFQPVEFSPFQKEHVIMSSCLVFSNDTDIEHVVCFSERMWKNMLAGKKPQGGKVFLHRDPHEWMSMDEITALTGKGGAKKYEGYDYLCIAAPKTILIGRQYKQVTSSFNLPFIAANEMVRQLRTEFVRLLLSWMRQELTFCDVKGIKRDIIMCIDHFFHHYGICQGTNMKDRDSMRRMAIRWLEDSKMIVNEIKDEDVTFVYKRENDDRQLSVEELLNDLKSEDKES